MNRKDQFSRYPILATSTKTRQGWGGQRLTRYTSLASSTISVLLANHLLVSTPDKNTSKGAMRKDTTGVQRTPRQGDWTPCSKSKENSMQTGETTPAKEFANRSTANAQHSSSRPNKRGAATQKRRRAGISRRYPARPVRNTRPAKSPADSLTLAHPNCWQCQAPRPQRGAR